MSSCISAIGTANPIYQFKQSRIYQFMADASGLDVNNRGRLKGIYDHSGIEYRYSVIRDFGADSVEDHTFFAKTESLEPFVSTRNRMLLYQKEAVNVAADAAKNCLAAFPEVITDQITHLITVSCTGMYAPGLDIDLVERLGLNTNTERTCINFMGCYGAINGLKTADYICRANPKAKVLVVSVELCTLHFQKENTLDNWVANSIFSDGAAAVLLENTEYRTGNKPCLELKYFYAEFLQQARNDMGWYVGNNGFEMKLTSKVAKQIRNNMAGVFERMKKSMGDINSNFDAYAIHPGGRKILEAVEEALELPEESTAFSYEVLQKYGNMSSATILFVLQKVLQNIIESNQQILCFAFGPGLTVEGMVLKTHVV
jgi:predicted naringenin-chalcone synthase